MISIIKEIRTELGLTQKEFADKAGFVGKGSVIQISLLENNHRKIGFNLLGKVVRHLASNGYDISLDVIVNVNDKKIGLH
jgi:transcriptional regulator with XRE-family HTH domain